MEIVSGLTKASLTNTLESAGRSSVRTIQCQSVLGGDILHRKLQVLTLAERLRQVSFIDLCQYASRVSISNGIYLKVP